MNKKYLDYVEEYFDNNFSIYRDQLNDNQYKELIYRACNILMEEYRGKLDLVKQGVGDLLIFDIVFDYFKRKLPNFNADCINLKNYIVRYISENYPVLYGTKTISYIADKIVFKLVPTYKYEDLINGKYDKEILANYEELEKRLPSEIRSYVTGYIAENIFLLTDLNEVDVANYFVNMIVNMDLMNAEDLFLHEYDEEIKKLAESNRIENESKRVASIPDTVKHIKEVLGKSAINSEFLDTIVKKIDTELRARKLTPTDIITDECKETIEKLYNQYYIESLQADFGMLDMSLKNEDTPSGIEYKGGKKNMSQSIGALLLAGVVSISSLYGLYSLGKGIRGHYAKSNLPTYAMMDSIYSSYIKVNADRVLNDYRNYLGYGDSYAYMSFYNAYLSSCIGDNVSEDNRLYVMDYLFNEVKTRAYTDVTYENLSDELRTDSCFLDFMYDRLEEMGYTDIKDEKYVELLSSYLVARNKFPHRAPIKSLNDSQKNLLNKVCKKYAELSDQYFIELGVIFGDTDGMATTNRRH